MKRVILSALISVPLAVLLCAAEPDEKTEIEQLREENGRLKATLVLKNKRIEALEKQIEELKAESAGSTNIVIKHEKIGKWEGFRGLKFGTKINDVPEMIPLNIKTATPGFALKAYHRKEDELVMVRAVLTEIRYLFHLDRFFSMFLTSDGYRNWRYLKSAVFAQYGKGHQVDKTDELYDPDVEQWLWGGGPEYSKVRIDDEDVVMVLEYNKLSKESKLTMTLMIDALDKQKWSK